MKFRMFLITMLMAIVAFSSFADTEIGVTYNKVVDKDSIGFTAKTEHSVNDNIDVEFDTHGQIADSEVRGRYHAEILLYDYLKIYQDTLFTGPVDGIGRTSDLGAAINLPVLGESGLGVGIFGRNNAPFAATSAADYLENGGYDQDWIDGLSDSDKAQTPVSNRLNVSSDTGVLGVIIYTDFEYQGIDVGLKLLPQVTGNDKAHQGVINTNWQYKFNERTGFNIGWDIRLQHYRDNIEYETAGTLSFTISL